MDAKARNCLLQHKEALERDIKTSYLMDHMISDRVLSLSEEEKIRDQPTQKKRAAMLIKVLLEKDNNSYISFYNALLHEGYKDLAFLLHDGIPLTSHNGKDSVDGVTPYVKTVLCEGGVPQRPVVFVTRKKLVKSIQEKLYKLNGEPGWVTVYGMAGCGKSVLAAEAVRDHSLLETCFPGGVHWVSIGKQDRSGLLMKLQNLCTRLDQDGAFSQRLPLNLEEAKDRLHFLMLRKCPRSLLILDDIWDSWVLKAFDSHHQILLTSRDKSVTDSVMGPKYVVPVESGLRKEKGLEILSLFVNMKKSDLPEQAHSIVRECKGSPLVVSLIGALLRDFPNRWGYYLSQLQNKQFKRIRKSSSYDYEALDEAMSISVERLSEDLQKYYKDLSILQKDVRVPTKVLCILWDMETEEVEDILQEFINKSLLFYDRNGKSFRYYLHDLQVDFLMEKNRDHLQELHRKVVSQFQKHCKVHALASDQEDSMYWYSFLAYHMASADMRQELRDLMFSLDWIKAKTELVGPAHLIHEFMQYGHLLDKKDCTICENFQEFLSLNGHLLGRQPFPNIVQLGLCEPETSEVYRQAKLRAKQEVDRGRLYLEWINKKTIKKLSRLVVRPHTDAVYHACFSEDGQRIASCGADKTLQVLKAETGERLLEIEAHEDEVLCCAFSKDDRFIATCSADKKVKIWNSWTGELVHTYDEHTEQVNCCHFTNMQHHLLLATGSSDFLLKLWDLNKKECRNTLFNHTNSVNHCRFSPDDKYLASCSADGTLKLWDVSSANEWSSIDVRQHFVNSDGLQEDVDVMVKCCSWSSDGARVMAAAANRLLVFDVHSGSLVGEIHTGHSSTIRYCDFFPKSHLAVVALSHYCVELWNTDTGSKVADCRGHLSWVHCVAFSPDGSSFLTSSDDQTIRLWETRKVCKNSAIMLKQEVDVVFREDEVIVLAIDNIRRLQLINGKTGHTDYLSEAQKPRISCCCLSPGLRYLALGEEDGSVKILELPNGREFRSRMGHEKAVRRVQFTSEGRTLISSSDDSTVQVWNWQSEEFVFLKAHQEPVKDFRLLQNPRLLTWSFDGTVKVWNILTGKVEKDFVCHQDTVLSCDVSPDTSKFSSTSADKTAKIWSFESHSPLHELRGHEGCVRCSVFSGDSALLATGDDNGEIRIWKVSTGERLHSCVPMTVEKGEAAYVGWVTDLRFSPDSKMLVSAGGCLKWWNVDTGESFQTFYTNGTNLKTIHVSPSFKTYVTVDNLGILYVLQALE
ncbi:apoptotic protease-activating factor 1 isoform X1 [Dromiciops gliroides]|uniref:apoptotic protease-activating factor 1 isoform X1 n=1 Tax=Dromiciops gliroides TaxID=33562 RepID=UPI001CC73885|nr:apoptotic protease-activating factor 1 isoform X1 [Dromiciops gliroides]XP_043825126.1 apoptotic protease-activating factor 1 isoform X1 [Dromiciops gliroides]XP_043825127.1 apoptotic protease-activating factor 1 isoform X1 [Dromiciops gliroides]